ncbi:MAG: DUF4258 domain-containing protein [Nitrospirae bacterium]|nr:DUF4258 domain-containing protein [Nitrospirota bacterium]
MKPIRYTEHALTNFKDREIPKEVVEQALTQPEKIEAGHSERQIYMKRYQDAVLDQEMLLRIIVEESETEMVVITAYKTSQIERYLKGDKT